jgi:hypothetical protein
MVVSKILGILSTELDNSTDGLRAGKETRLQRTRTLHDVNRAAPIVHHILSSIRYTLHYWHLYVRFLWRPDAIS